MGATKHSHYVPRVYLRRFSDNQKQLYCLEKSSFKIKRLGVADVCVGKDFYAQTSIKDGSKDRVIESTFADYEKSVVAPALKRIPSTFLYGYSEGQKVIDDNLKNELVEIMSSQLFRGLATRDFSRKTSKRLFGDEIRQLKRIAKHTSNESLFRDIERIKDRRNIIMNNSQVVGVAGVAAIRGNSAVKELLKEKVCILLLNTTKHHFITSDEPVLIIGDNLEDCGLYNCPFIYPGTKIYYPLDPTHMIAFYDQRSLLGAELDGVAMFLGEDDLAFITNMNIAQIKQARNFAIAYTADDFVL